MNKDEVALAMKWQKAPDVAKHAGFCSLGESDEAYFEVKLDR
ncbi:hypothetical protein [Polaromonas jejuensis]|uniref:Uncharacterized protein n=1 Tax=Polaromonas jejuensis TaxID=457502 RepID=A0ABW0QHY8_9BURK|nr:hypothetical protein [Polaromonas jejuensis]